MQDSALDPGVGGDVEVGGVRDLGVWTKGRGQGAGAIKQAQGPGASWEPGARGQRPRAREPGAKR